VGRQAARGLTNLRGAGSSFAAKSYTQADGLAQNSVFAVHQSRDGTVWAGTLSGGVSRLRNGKLTTYTTANGLASNTVSSILEGADGTMWFATPNGLSALAADGWRVYLMRQGLPADSVNCLLEDSAGVLWTNSQPDMTLVAQAASGGEGVQKFREHRPDITLMDLRLPDMSGIDSMIAIRTEFPDARIVMLTTFEGDVEIQRSLQPELAATY
jgi:ligand-binding sensor domain-containing protein